MLYLQGQNGAPAKFNCIASRGPARASAESTERDQLDGVRNARDIDWLAGHPRPLWTGADALLTVGHTFTLRMGQCLHIHAHFSIHVTSRV